ncbi:MAG: Eukaryotic translation initiation factor 3 subunit 10 [Devosia sp.]|uniref:DUF4167 domain-containing protein n=1 Tax=Devosia sp. TaxID=1871048 RepID=UPI0026352F53|nr:DUF4167 domain-containing protein [Devosia sp.]MDB5540378.1 Eukaryotic translation initiation factor 3 subunit 10 [Devosia sp.]
MRPNQQNNNKNRSRGRNNNGGRKHGNPLSRNYESNGPDVKVRGNASHIAEKYLQLARDAQSSGDSVMAENYLQHAEHYFRIISAAQPQNQQRDQFGQPAEDDDYDDDFAPMNDRFASPEPRQFNQQPQQQNDQQQPQQSIPGSEPVVMAVVEANAAPQGEGDAPQGEGEPRRHRERRPRRRSRGQGGEGGNDPAGAPQPDVGELPAFLTVGNTPAE